MSLILKMWLRDRASKLICPTLDRAVLLLKRSQIDSTPDENTKAKCEGFEEDTTTCYTCEEIEDVVGLSV
jgi:hypothetical protein